MVARVRLFCLYGLYKSSSSTRVLASMIDFFKSSVSFPCSSMEFNILSFFSSRFLRYFNLASNFLSISSSSEPVASFLYLAINGIVFPSSISFITLSACDVFMLSSWDNVSAIIILFIQFSSFSNRLIFLLKLIYFFIILTLFLFSSYLNLIYVFFHFPLILISVITIISKT